jgi:hypothetical protein
MTSQDPRHQQHWTAHRRPCPPMSTHSPIHRDQHTELLFFLYIRKVPHSDHKGHVKRVARGIFKSTLYKCMKPDINYVRQICNCYQHHIWSTLYLFFSVFPFLSNGEIPLKASNWKILCEMWVILLFDQWPELYISGVEPSGSIYRFSFRYVKYDVHASLYIYIYIYMHAYILI